jgi:hypothetical protein
MTCRLLIAILTAAVLSSLCSCSLVPQLDRAFGGHGSYWHDTHTGGKSWMEVDLKRQVATFYRGPNKMGVSAISSGDERHRTPDGTYHILEKTGDQVFRLLWPRGGCPGQSRQHQCHPRLPRPSRRPLPPCTHALLDATNVVRHRDASGFPSRLRREPRVHPDGQESGAAVLQCSLRRHESEGFGRVNSGDDPDLVPTGRAMTFRLPGEAFTAVRKRRSAEDGGPRGCVGGRGK